MGKERRFFRQVITIEVLSEGVPLEWDNLRDVEYAITHGECVGKVEEISCATMTAAGMAVKLREVGFEPGFFQLDDKGNDLQKTQEVKA